MINLGDDQCNNPHDSGASFKDPLIVVGGYFNHRDISNLLVDTCPFEVLETGPTRGPNRLDLVYTTFHAKVKKTGSPCAPAL